MNCNEFNKNNQYNQFKKVFVKVEDNIASINECTEFLKDEKCGAINIFCGMVRKDNANLEFLYFECYKTMAYKKLISIGNELIEQSKGLIKKVYIYHRKGYVKVGELCLVLGLVSQHRKVSFEYMPILLEKIKLQVPIWKKEIYYDSYKTSKGNWLTNPECKLKNSFFK